MDRRSFVTTLAVCPPALLTLTKKRAATRASHPAWWYDTLLVGLGSAGFGVACLLDRHDAAPVNVMGFLGQRACRYSGTRETWLHRVLRGPQGALHARQEVNFQLSDRRSPIPPYSVVVMGLGGVTGSTIIGPLLEQLTEVSAVRVVATLPLKFEGRRRERRAAEAFSAIHWSDASYSITDLEAVRAATKPLGSYGEFLRGMDRRLASEVVQVIANRPRTGWGRGRPGLGARLDVRKAIRGQTDGD